MLGRELTRNFSLMRYTLVTTKCTYAESLASCWGDGS